MKTYRQNPVVLLLATFGSTAATARTGAVAACAGSALEAGGGEAWRSAGRVSRALRRSQIYGVRKTEIAAFEDFVRRSYAGDEATRDALFQRFEYNLEVIDGHYHEVGREFRNPLDLDVGQVHGFDEIFGAYDPSAHLADDFFANKLAFTVLLNFPQTTLGQRLSQGAGWTRRQWAETRLAERFSSRVPAHVNQAVADAAAASDQYIAQYNIWMHHLVNNDGKRLFPPKLRLLSHWNLRDQIKADYSDATDGLARQRTIAKVMEHIVLQSIPAVVIDNPAVDWNPQANVVSMTKVNDSGRLLPLAAEPGNAPEPDQRYAMLLDNFKAMQRLDAYSPLAPTHIARSFEMDRQLPEARVQAMLELVLASGRCQGSLRSFASALGRELEPFDIWYERLPVTLQYTRRSSSHRRRKYPPQQPTTGHPEPVCASLASPMRAHVTCCPTIVVTRTWTAMHWLTDAAAKAHLRTRIGPTEWTTRDSTSPCMKWATTSSRRFTHRHRPYLAVRRTQHRVHRSACLRVPGLDLELLGGWTRRIRATTR